MKKEIIKTNLAPKAIGPYSQAVKFGNLLFLSGQISIEPKLNKLIKGSIEEQTEQVIKNIQGCLKAANSSLENILKVGIFLKDMNDFSKMNEVYDKYFPNNPPARFAVEVSRLPKDVSIEMECTAFIE